MHDIIERIMSRIIDMSEGFRDDRDRDRTSMDRSTKFYHASPKLFRRGDMLRGDCQGGYSQAVDRSEYSHPNVCMTSSIVPHATIIDIAVRDDWYIYEVEPVGEVYHVPGNDELQTRMARVVARVGRAGRFKDKKRGSIVHAAPRGTRSSGSTHRNRRDMTLQDPTGTRAREKIIRKYGL